MDVQLVGGGGDDASQFLVSDEDEAVLVDTGTGLTVEPTLRNLTEQLGSRRSLIGIHLTHEHIDHVGAAAALSSHYHVPVRVPTPLLDALQRGDGAVTLASSFGAVCPPIPDARGFDIGEQIRVGGSTWEVLHTPGHTSAHTSLWHRESRSLIAGDAVFADGAFGRVDLPTGNGDAMVRTLDELVTRDVVNLYPGHMQVVVGEAGRHVRMAADHARSMLGHT